MNWNKPHPRASHQISTAQGLPEQKLDDPDATLSAGELAIPLGAKFGLPNLPGLNTISWGPLVSCNELTLESDMR